MTDPTVLETTAIAILNVLKDAAEDMGWQPKNACVTAGTASIDCDSIHVWPDSISPTRDSAGESCHVVLRTRFQYAVAVCIGANRVETCKFWNEHSAEVHDKIWALEVALVVATLTNNFCGVGCGQVRFEPFTLVPPEGDVQVWQGALSIDLSPQALAS